MGEFFRAQPAGSGLGAPGRGRLIMRASSINVAANVLLTIFKMAIGLLSNSIAIVLGAVNNLTDALSSVVTLIGTRLSKKSPDSKHPFGYGRTEYVVTFVVAALILYAGVGSLKESVLRILSPEASSYDATAFIILGAATVVKVFLGNYLIKQGRLIDARMLVGSGAEARYDAVVSAATMGAALVYLKTGIILDGLIGAVIAVLIIKTGIEILASAISKILGERASGHLTSEIRRHVTEYEGVHGAYDLVIVDYGPERLEGSVHIELDDTMTVGEVDALTRDIQHGVREQFGVVLHTIGIYSTNTGNEQAIQMREAVSAIVWKRPTVKEMHGFYVNEKRKSISFDVVISFDDKNRFSTFNSIVSEIAERYPDYRIKVGLDPDVND